MSKVRIHYFGHSAFALETEDKQAVIIEDSNMEEKIRNDFIVDIKRNVLNINFLVQSLLKLSKFDANTVHFVKQEND